MKHAETIKIETKNTQSHRFSCKLDQCKEQQSLAEIHLSLGLMSQQDQLIVTICHMLEAERVKGICLILCFIVTHRIHVWYIC